MDKCVVSSVVSAVRSDFGTWFVPLQTLEELSLKLNWWQTLETSLMAPLEKGQRLEEPWAWAGPDHKATHHPTERWRGQAKINRDEAAACHSLWVR